MSILQNDEMQEKLNLEFAKALAYLATIRRLAKKDELDADDHETISFIQQEQKRMDGLFDEEPTMAAIIDFFLN